jgi:hypothetical protein
MRIGAYLKSRRAMASNEPSAGKETPPLAKFLGVFSLANGDTVRILLPARTDIVSMTEEALVAVNELRPRLPGLIPSPRRRIGVLS